MANITEKMTSGEMNRETKARFTNGDAKSTEKNLRRGSFLRKILTGMKHEGCFSQAQS